MLTIDMKLSKESRKTLDKYPGRFKNGIIKGMKSAMLFAEGEAKKSFGRPGNLKVGTGHLRRSIRSNVKVSGSNVIGSVESNVIYAEIHEIGGIIRARNAKYLHFKVDNRWVKVKQVKIPARPYLRPAIEDNLPKIGDIISKYILQETGGR